MFKFKAIKPFVTEMIILLFTVAVVVTGLLTGNFIEITVKQHFISIAFIVIAGGLFLFLFVRVVNLGVRALFDFVFKRTKSDSYEFIKELPYRASVFSEKSGPNHQSSYGMYYLIQAKNNGKIFTFISPSFIDLETDKRYVFKTGLSSHIVVEWSKE